MPHLDLESVVLVAYELPTEENLGARYVAQALLQAGFNVRLLGLNGPGELVAVANEILSIAPGLVGFSMSDNQVATLQLTLIAYLRSRGYAGRIVAGGAFATVARRELLVKHEGLDAVIRREGERPMVLLARALRDGDCLDLVPGTTTRTGDGPAYVEDRVLPVPRPFRNRLPKLLGVPMARVMASRGCNGGCAYCGSAAVRHDATAEARRAGLSLEQIREQGVSTQRHRSLSDFAEEVSELYHQHGVRFFRLIDDHILGPDAARAEKWLNCLSRELALRGVAQAAFSLMVEPSVITDAVADAMAELGVVRVLVGVEALTESGLRAIGRNANLLGSNRAAVQRLHERGIAVFYNSIFLHPASTAESVRAELDALPFVPGVAFDVLPLLVFPGTTFFARLEREGRLLGGMLACDYEIADPTVSLLRSLLHGLSRRLPLLAAMSLSAHEVASLESLSRRLGQGGLSARQRRALHIAIDELGALRRELLLALLDHAQVAGHEADHVEWLEHLVLAARPRLGPLSAQFETLRRLLEQFSPSAREANRRRATAALAAGLLAMGPGCGGEVESEGSPSSGGTSTVAASGGATTAQGGTTSTGAGGTLGLGGRISIDLSQGGTTTLTPYLSTVCDMATDEAISTRLGAISWAACNFSGVGCGWELVLRVDETGTVTDVIIPSELSNSNSYNWDEVRPCLIKTFSQERYPCLKDGFAWTNQCVLLL